MKTEIENLFNCDCLIKEKPPGLELKLIFNSETPETDWGGILNLKKLNLLTDIVKYKNIKIVGTEVSYDFDNEDFNHSFNLICDDDLF